MSSPPQDVTNFSAPHVQDAKISGIAIAHFQEGWCDYTRPFLPKVWQDVALPKCRKCSLGTFSAFDTNVIWEHLW